MTKKEINTRLNKVLIRTKHWLYAHYLGIIVFLAALVIYVPVLGHEFVWDDPSFIVSWDALEVFPSNVTELLMGELPAIHQKAYRPLRSIFYGISYLLWQENPQGYHIQAILVHALMSLFVYLLAYELLKSKFQAWVAGILFAVHPIHIEAITWITASMDTIGTLFMLMSLWAHVRYRKRKTLEYWYISGACAGLAFFTYELTLTLPALLICFDWLFYSKKVRSVPDIWQDHKLVLSLNASYWLIRFGILQLHSFHQRMFESVWGTFLAMLIALRKYLQLLILPLEQTVNHQLRPDLTAFYYHDYNFEAAPSFPLLRDVDILVSLAIVGGLLALAWYSRKRWPLLSFSIFWFFIGLIPVLQIFPRAIIFAERNLYPASILFVIVASQLLCKIKPASARNLLLVFVVGIYSYLTLGYNQVWQNELRLWQHVIKTTPTSATAYQNVGHAFEQQGEMNQALAYYQKAAELNPNAPVHWLNLASLSVAMDDTAQAISAIQQVNRLLPNDPSYYLQLAQLYEANQEWELALAAYTRASQISGPDPQISTKIYLLEEQLNQRPR